MQLRDAVEEDVPGILGIYNDVIATSTAIYSYVPVTLEDRTQWWRARVAMGYPVPAVQAKIVGSCANPKLVRTTGRD